MKQFMGQKHIVAYRAPRNKRILVRRDELGKQRACDEQEFLNDFIANIAQADWSELGSFGLGPFRSSTG